MSSERRANHPIVRLTMTIAVLIAASGCGGEPELIGFRPTGASAPLPQAQLATVTSDEFEHIMVGLRGRPVIVNVWASWCIPCRAEAPLLRRAGQNDAVQIIGVHGGSNSKEAGKFLTEFDLAYPNVQSNGASVLQLLNATTFPTTIAFDAAGRVRGVTVGGLTEQRLSAMIADVGA